MLSGCRTGFGAAPAKKLVEFSGVRASNRTLRFLDPAPATNWGRGRETYVHGTNQQLYSERGFAGAVLGFGQGYNKMIRFQERDNRILRLSYEQRVLTAPMIRKFIFRDIDERAYRRRLLLLEKAGLIRLDQRVQYYGNRLVQLTRAGRIVVESALGIRIPQTQKLDLNTLLHDAAVTTVRLRLEELWDGRWLPESLLKSEELRQIPDGLWLFPNGNRVAVEVERTPKGPTRFHELQSRWRGVRVRIVLVVAMGEAMEQQARKYIETGPADLPFGLVRLDALEDGTPKVWSRAGELDLFNRRNF